MVLHGLKIGCLGGGAMGEALLTGVIEAGLVSPRDVFVTDVRNERTGYLKEKLGVNAAADNRRAASGADILILAVKPQVVASLLEEIAPDLVPEKSVISIAAGINTGFIEKFFDLPVPVVRVMPNTPCLVGAGASAVSPGKHAQKAHLDQAMAIFSAAGRAEVVPEQLLDVVTGLSGSGPAYMYLILEGLVDGAVRLGLPRSTALLLCAQTMLGAARMVLETGQHPAMLKDMVTTPGGTTIAGLFALEEGGMRGLLMEAVEAATRRSQELSG